MAFDKNSLIRIGGGLIRGGGHTGSLWFYNTGDAKATVDDTGYFATIGGTANSDGDIEGNDAGDTGQLQTWDVILVKCSDAVMLMHFANEAAAEAGTATFITLATS